MQLGVRAACLVAIVAVAASLTIASRALASGTFGALAALPGSAGCFGGFLPESCGRAPAVGGQAVPSPDDRYLYVTSSANSSYPPTLGADSLGGYRRGTRAGALTPLSGAAGCFRGAGAAGDDPFGCAHTELFTYIQALAIAPDGQQLYASIFGGRASTGAILTFARNVATGDLAWVGCTTSDGRDCGQEDPNGSGTSFGILAASRDGKNIYAAGGRIGAGVVAVFARDKTTGQLSPLPGPGGCIASVSTPGCSVARGFHGWVSQLAVSPDDRNLYVTSAQSQGGVDGGSILVFEREATTGGLRQLSGAAGCLNTLGDGDCQRGRTIGRKDGGLTAVDITHEGRNVYAAFIDSADPGRRSTGGVAIFARNPASGELAQLGGSEGCISDARRIDCTHGRHLWPIQDIALSPRGRNLYALSVDRELTAFGRDRETGALSQLSGKRGCLHFALLNCRRFGTDSGVGESLIVSRDGGNVYTFSSSDVAVVARNPPVVRLLRQKPNCSRSGARIRVRVWAYPALAGLRIAVGGRPVAADHRSAVTVRIPSTMLKKPRQSFKATAIDSLGHRTTRRARIRGCLTR